jgi:DNA repair exonuclease SbcCD ATPase subunit
MMNEADWITVCDLLSEELIEALTLLESQSKDESLKNKWKKRIKELKEDAAPIRDGASDFPENPKVKKIPYNAMTNKEKVYSLEDEMHGLLENSIEDLELLRQLNPDDRCFDGWAWRIKQLKARLSEYE